MHIGGRWWQARMREGGPCPLAKPLRSHPLKFPLKFLDILGPQCPDDRGGGGERAVVWGGFPYLVAMATERSCRGPPHCPQGCVPWRLSRAVGLGKEGANVERPRGASGDSGRQVARGLQTRPPGRQVPGCARGPQCRPLPVEGTAGNLEVPGPPPGRALLCSKSHKVLPPGSTHHCHHSPCFRQNLGTWLRREAHLPDLVVVPRPPLSRGRSRGALLPGVPPS